MELDGAYALQEHRIQAAVLLGRGGSGQVLFALLGCHQNGSASTASAAVSIASCTGLPTTGTTDATAPPTRIGTVATLVKRHPDSPNNSSRSVSHLIPYISKPPSRRRRQRATPSGERGWRSWPCESCIASPVLLSL